MSLEKPPPSRYRVEEKNGLLIVHDSMAGGKVSSPAPQAQPRSALDGASRAAPAVPNPAAPNPAAPNPAGLNLAGPKPAGPASMDSAKAKRMGSIAAIGIFLALFLLFTGLWPIMAIAMIVMPLRKQLLGSFLPLVKRYIEEGRLG